MADGSIGLSALAMKSAVATPTWDNLSAAERAPYESEASILHERYQEEYRAFIERSSSLQSQKKELLANGDYTARTLTKRISPYRVYKRETAAQIKAEFPLMSNEERS